MRTRRTRTHLQFSSPAWIEIDTGLLAAVTGPACRLAGGRRTCVARRTRLRRFVGSSCWTRRSNKGRKQTIYFNLQNDWPEPVEDSDSGKGMGKRGKTKHRKKMPLQHPAPPKPSNTNVTLMEIKRIFLTLSTVTMGCCYSGVKGVSGSIRPKSLLNVLNALSTNGGHLVDFGCGFGRVLLSALAYGFHGATGWEFVENETQRIAFERTKAKLHAYSDANWIGQDILTLDPTQELCGQVTSAYAFWVGFPIPEQLRILDLCRLAFTNICSVAVFLDTKWRKPKNGTVFLQHTCKTTVKPKHIYISSRINCAGESADTIPD